MANAANPPTRARNMLGPAGASPSNSAATIVSGGRFATSKRARWHQVVALRTSRGYTARGYNTHDYSACPAPKGPDDRPDRPDRTDRNALPALPPHWSG